MKSPSLVITPNDDWARLYIMEGWQEPIVHQGQKRLVFDPILRQGERSRPQRLRVIFRTTRRTSQLRYSYKLSPVSPARFQPTALKIDLDGKPAGKTTLGGPSPFEIRGVVERHISPGLHYLTLTPCPDQLLAPAMQPPSGLPCGLPPEAAFIERIQLDW